MISRHRIPMNSVVAAIHTHFPGSSDSDTRDSTKYILFVFRAFRARLRTTFARFRFLSLWSCVVINSSTNASWFDQIVFDGFLLVCLVSKNINGSLRLLVLLIERIVGWGLNFGRLCFPPDLRKLLPHFRHYHLSL